MVRVGRRAGEPAAVRREVEARPLVVPSCVSSRWLRALYILLNVSWTVDGVGVDGTFDLVLVDNL